MQYLLIVNIRPIAYRITDWGRYNGDKNLTQLIQQHRKEILAVLDEKIKEAIVEESFPYTMKLFAKDREVRVFCEIEYGLFGRVNEYLLRVSDHLWKAGLTTSEIKKVF